MSFDAFFDEIDFLQSYHVDIVSISRALQECEADFLATNDFTKIMSPVVSQRPAEMTTPITFKKPAEFFSPYRLAKPQMCANKKIYHSLSKSSTPKTPAFMHHQGTPLLSTFNLGLLTTPMLMKTLDNIQEEASYNDKLAPYPDILQLIDDDSRCTEEFSEVNVTDNNLVEYLLDLSQEVKHNVSSDRKTLVENKQSMDVVHKSPPRPFHRARHRTKLLTEEERISIQRHQREKRKQKRKDRFANAPKMGTRKSQRVRTKVVRYS